jgi:acetyl-CoA carboxylase biotin carboxyl carrier protein
VNSTQQISFKEVLELVELVKSSANFSELRIRSGDLEIDVRRGSSGLPPAAGSPMPAPPPPRPASTAPASVAPPAAPMAAPAAAGPAHATTRPAAKVVAREGASVVKAPMVGTIYHASEPGAAPFVALGQRVEAGAQLCIIEVMKLMNAVLAESAGTVSEILAADGEAVEFDQALYVITPA